MKFLSLLFSSLAFAVTAASLSAATNNSAAHGQPLPGQIVIDPEDSRWLKRHGGPHVFICGPGDPESFLYRGTRNSDGTRSGDQLELIDKLIAHGGNCIYMQVVRTHGGDAKPDATHNPFIDSDPAKGLDPRILAQWEQWFRRMDEHGILIYLYFYDDSARIWDTGDVVSPPERAFFETIVRRFQHHRNLIWIIGEESEERYTHVRVRALADIIQQTDRHKHVIGNHHLNGSVFKAWKPGSALTHFAMQFRATGDGAHAAAIEAGQLAGNRYQIIFSESTATPEDPDGMRLHAWAVAMGGLMPMLYRMEIVNTPVALLAQCRHLQQFFESTDFHTLAPHDELKHAETQYVLADPGCSYIAYASRAVSNIGLKELPAGKCAVTWLDCVTGRSTTEEHRFSEPGDRAFRKPADLGPECAAWIRFPEIKRRRESAPRMPETAASSVPRGNRPPAVVNQEFATGTGTALYIQLAFTDDDGPGPYSYTIVGGPQHGALKGDNNDRTYTPAPGFTGEDRFTWKAGDSLAESRVATVTIRVGSATNEGGRPAN